MIYYQIITVTAVVILWFLIIQCIVDDYKRKNRNDK